MEKRFQMKLSIIIPAYNAEKTIINALDSVYNQQNINDLAFEVIVINDGSTDNTFEVASNYSEKVNNLTVYSKENGGVSSARNYAIEKAIGEWIAFLDSDDVWLDCKLDKQFKVIDEVKSIDFIGCARNNEKLTVLGHKIDELYKATVNDLLIKMFPQTSTALVKKSLLDKVGYYDETMTHAEDGDLWVRLCHEGDFYYLPDSLVTTGNGKNNFGDRGLSGDLEKMHLGTLKTLVKSRENKLISRTMYCFYKIFYELKFLRRKLIVKVR